MTWQGEVKLTEGTGNAGRLTEDLFMSCEVSEELVELMWSFCVLMVGVLTVCSQKPE